MSRSKRFILWFNELSIGDVPYVGGKNASLGEMYRNLTKRGVNVPNGFAVTAYAYRYLLQHAGVERDIKNILSKLNVHNVRDLAEKGRKIREIIRKAKFPPELKDAIHTAYQKLCRKYGKDTDVAVRSSATAEDLPTASFAGQQETYLNIRGEHELIDACRKCFASLFTNRAISYREDKGFDHFKVALSIGVQKMVRSDLASSGVMFSIDTESGFKDAAFITAAYGLGENVVQGAVNPDEYYVFKPTLKKGYKPVLSKKVGTKHMRMVYTSEGNKTTKNIEVPEKERQLFVLEDEEILTLARWACIIEDYYSKKAGYFKPMDMEWAKDGRTGKLFIVQARPETVESQKEKNVLEEYKLGRRGKVLAMGKSVGSKIGQGKAHIIKDVKDIARFKKGEVLVTEMTDPDWEPIMKIASAIVTNRGGRTCFTGDTIVLTDKGFMKMKEIYDNHEGLKVPSLNRTTLKMEWKPVIASMKKRSDTIGISVSQTGRVKDNILQLTPDHKMLTFENRQLIGKEIQDIIKSEDMLLLAQRLPSLSESSLKEQNIAYLMGALSTDGHIYLSRTHGETQFIQKPTKEKQEFINHVKLCMKSTFNKEFKECIKKTSEGKIRGQSAVGNANAYRCYSKQIASELKLEGENFIETLLHADTEFIYNFLGGVIDGDGSFNNGRIQIYCSKQGLLQQITVSCLRLGIVPQVTKNRGINNIQIVERVEELLKYTKRVKGKYERTKFGTRFFSARSVFADNAKKIKGQIKLRVEKNLYVDEKEMRRNQEKLDAAGIDEVNKILNSDTRMHRTSFVDSLGEQDVYNITVEDNHNYIVFTDRYTPVLVNNCHAAIISRELGIPCVVGCIDATEHVKNGRKITVSCAEGEVGYVYDGLLRFKINKVNLKKMPKTRTKVMMNVGNPDQAFEFSKIPNEGVGLAREEFIISSYIKIHPRALMDYKHLKDKEVKEDIDELTSAWKDKTKFFVDKLAMGIGTIAAAFYPKPVIVRMSDFKSNEYANLIGGHHYEPKEDNPMIGWRGASRYYKEGYKAAFALECKAIKKVRKVMGLKNLIVMIPFCRTVEEGKKVQKEMAKYGLKRGKEGLKIFVMCEIPANVVLAEQFSKIFDGFSIGSNDLTQLTLGLDRDSELVADIYDERNDAVKWMVSHVIKTAKKKHRKIGICGQAPSDYPDFARFLVRNKIDSISLNPDSVIATTLHIAQEEKRMRRR